MFINSSFLLKIIYMFGFVMNLPLMPKSTAVWLIENTVLTFDQIAEFCGLHSLEVKGIADGEVATGIVGINPITSSQLTQEEITKCENDPKRKLHLSENALKHAKVRKKKTAKYTPVARRQDKPDAVAWFLRYHPETLDAQIVKLIGTTKTTIASIKEKSHWNIANIKPRDPVLLGLCSQVELDNLLAKVKTTKES